MNKNILFYCILFLLFPSNAMFSSSNSKISFIKNNKLISGCIVSLSVCVIGYFLWKLKKNSNQNNVASDEDSIENENTLQSVEDKEFITWIKYFFGYEKTIRQIFKELDVEGVKALEFKNFFLISYCSLDSALANLETLKGIDDNFCTNNVRLISQLESKLANNDVNRLETLREIFRLKEVIDQKLYETYGLTCTNEFVKRICLKTLKSKTIYIDKLPLYKKNNETTYSNLFYLFKSVKRKFPQIFESYCPKIIFLGESTDEYHNRSSHEQHWEISYGDYYVNYQWDNAETIHFVCREEDKRIEHV